MKRTFYCLALSLIAILLVSCQSKEDKAATLIKNELSKTLYDFESYQPTETVIKEAKMTMYNDSACWNKAALIYYGAEKAREYIKDAKNAQENMEMWRRPSFSSSNFTNFQYNKYKEEYEEQLEKAKTAYNICETIATELKSIIAKLDTSKVIGWEVKHGFRCKTLGGYSSISNYRYVLDYDFKNVLLREDLDDEEESQIREVLKMVVDGEFDK